MSSYQSRLQKYSAFIIGFLLCCFLNSAEAETLNTSNMMLTSSNNKEYAAPSYPESTSFRPPFISTAIGQVLSSINIGAHSIVILKDGKTAFATLPDGILHILDMSNLESPTIINTLNLEFSRNPFQGKTLALSPDEKILYASNMHHLEIIDISNLATPVILGQFEDLNLAKNIKASSMFYSSDWNYRVSFATSKDNQTLFIGGLGIQVIDISDKTKPNLITSNTKQVSEDNLLKTEIKISPQKDILYSVTNGILKIFNIEDPKDFKLLGEYSPENYQITSLLVSKQSETAFLLGKDRNLEARYEKIDLTDPTKPAQLKSYNLNYNADNWDISFSKLSFNETIAYILIPYREIGVLNLWNNEFQVEKKSLAQGYVNALTVFPSDESKVMIRQGNFLKVIEFFTHFPNNRIFSFSKNSLGSLKFQGLKIYSTILFSDEKTLLIYRGSGFSGFSNKEGIIEIVNISDYSNPVLISSIKVKPTIQVQLLQDEKKAILTYNTIGNSGFSLLDLSDLSDPKINANFEQPFSRQINRAHFSSDGKIGWVIAFGGTKTFLQVMEFSDDFAKGKVLSEIFIDVTVSHIISTKNNETLILIAPYKIILVNVSNPEKPILISSVLISSSSDQSRKVLFAALSPDEKTIYTQICTLSRCSFAIYDMSNHTNLKIASDTTLPLLSNPEKKDVAFSSDYQIAYMPSTKGYILAVNISNQTLPFIQGTFRVEDLGEPITFKMTKESKIIIYSKESILGIANLAVPHTLHFNTESVRLGEKYTGSVGLYRLNSRQRYETYDDSYKYLSVSLFNTKINLTNYIPECSDLPLPYWMNFDKDNRIFSLEPKKPQNLGAYTLHSVFSPRIPDNAFVSLNLGQDEADLFVALVGLGYLDNKKFLTSANLGSLQDFMLPKGYLSFKSEIYSILKNYYLETFTMFEIFPSLDVIYGDKISLQTLSDDPIHVEIKLLCGHGKFINKPYGSVVPKVAEGTKSGIVLEGSQEEINMALQNLVIDLHQNITTCDGTITISDHLNPVAINSLMNVSRFFEINKPPEVYQPVQEQIDQAQDLYTGVYFVIPLSSKTFNDSFNDGLHYELAMEDPSKSVPTWLSFSNMSFHGTPPEEFTGLEKKIILVVKNEFKETRVPLTLRIKISPMFALKLLARYSPMILSIIGLIVYFNQIYNIVFRERYRYLKEFYFDVGKEINAGVMSPIQFIPEEKQESLVVLDYLKEILNKEEGVSTNNKLVYYFANEEKSRLDQDKIQKKIEEVFSKAPENILEKLPIYCKGAEASQMLINKMVFNQLTLWFLDNHQETKKVFDKIKDNWIDLVEWDENAMCKVNEKKLNEFLFDGRDIENRSDYNIMKDEEILNLDLLKDAIESYALTKQSINYLAIKAHVIIREKKPRNFLLRLIKRDLQMVNFGNNGKMGYGMFYKVQNDVLKFYGVPEENFANKTLVVQITSKRQRILREIWIHGISENRFIQKNVKLSQPTNERISRGKEYEVY